MRNKFFRIVAVALTIACLLSLGGCMSKSDDNKSSDRVEPPKDIWAPYSQTVTITTMGSRTLELPEE